MPIKINCIYNDQGAWCINKKIKRSLFGIGARCCVDFPYSNNCEYRQGTPRPNIFPPPPPQRKQKIE